uniref:Uncharacterized protein n=1 Tax=Pristionchus pacificus TaxID=54126 RepID=A0A2A6BAE4_PRIPA|eukprot:PDM62855.1 hypothetical protein PRIPAC_50070 [Pristionchus pacificus]
MLRWISDKLQSPGGDTLHSSRPSPRRQTESAGSQLWNAAFASDPAEWEQGFDKCWNRAERLLDAPILRPEKEISFEQLQELMALLQRMVQFLMMEVNAQPEPAIGPILDRFFTHQIVERVLDWAQQAPDFLKPSCQLSLIRIYEHIVSEKSLLARAQTDPQPASEALFVICMKMAKDATLLHFFFTCTDEFMVFSLLIPFLYEMNDVGQLARDALLLILAVSAKQQEVAEFVADKSAFCPVVATGLGGCFSQLSFVLAGDGAERLLPEAPAANLANFNAALLFCNAVVQVAHDAVVDKIAEYFYSGFLILVVKPALLQADDRDAVAAATVYLQVILETLTERALVRTVLRMLLVERDVDDEERRTMMTVVVERVKTGDKLSVVSLSLLERVLDLLCEDALLVLALRPLLPMRGVTRAQVARVRERAYASSLATRLLAAVPTTMLRFPEICSSSSLEQYLQEAADLVDARAKGCAGWNWRYDGVSPSPALFRSESDDDGHTPFTRLSSVRSSFSTAGRDLNRYFSLSARSGHHTAESLGRQLGELGESPPRSSTGSMEDESELEEDAEFVLPKMTASALMQSSMVDYLTLTAYESLSESDSGGAGEMIIIEDARSVPDASSSSSSVFPTAASTTAAGAAAAADEEEASKNYGAEVFEEWENIKDDVGAFNKAMAALPSPPKKKKEGGGGEKDLSFDELASLIHSRAQYFDECSAEEKERQARVHAVEEAEGEVRREKERRGERREEGEGRGGGWRGESIEDNQGTPLLSVLLQKLAAMDDQSMAFNLQLCSFLYSLASFPQPLLVLAIFGGGSEKAGEGEGLVSILESLKDRVDAALATLEGADMWIRRALRNLAHRADRIERAPDAATPRTIEGLRSDASRDMENGSPTGAHAPLTRARPFGGNAAKEDARAKDLAHAAILLANLCQMLAGIALHQSVVVHNARTMDSYDDAPLVAVRKEKTGSTPSSAISRKKVIISSDEEEEESAAPAAAVNVDSDDPEGDAALPAIVSKPAEISPASCTSSGKENETSSSVKKAAAAASRKRKADSATPEKKMEKERGKLVYSSDSEGEKMEEDADSEANDAEEEKKPVKKTVPRRKVKVKKGGKGKKKVEEEEEEEEDEASDESEMSDDEEDSEDEEEEEEDSEEESKPKRKAGKKSSMVVSGVSDSDDDKPLMRKTPVGKKKAAKKAESDSDDEPLVKKTPAGKKKAAKKAESDSDDDSPLVKKTKRKTPVKASNKAESDSDDDEPLVKKKTKSPAKAAKKSESDYSDDDEPLVKNKEKKTPAKAAKKAESDDSEDDDEPLVKKKEKKTPAKKSAKAVDSDDEPLVKKKAVATPRKTPAKKPKKGDEEERGAKKKPKKDKAPRKKKEVKVSTPSSGDDGNSSSSLSSDEDEEMREEKEEEEVEEKKMVKREDGAESSDTSINSESEGRKERERLKKMKKTKEPAAKKPKKEVKKEEDDVEDGEEKEKEEKKGRGKGGKTKGEEQKAMRLANLRKVANRMKLIINYKNLFENTPDSDSARVKAVERYLEQKGFEKPHTLERAVAWREARETAAELAELSRNDIIHAVSDNPRVRVTRSQRAAAPVNAPAAKKSRRAALDSSDDEEERDDEDEESSEEEKDPFANLKGIISDGEGSD